MLLLKYLNEQKEYQVSFELISTNIVQITGNFQIKTSGFTLSRENEEDDWDYSAYTTIYREIDGGAQFSNDGSVYVEHEQDSETDFDSGRTDYAPPLSNQELTEAVGDLMYEVDCMKLGL